MIPDYCEAITAYRSFDAFPNGLLMGESVAEPWPTYAPMVGRCNSISGTGWRDHVADGSFVPAPAFGCHCGVHALKSRQDALNRAVHSNGFVVSLHGGHIDEAQPPKSKVWGAVKLWGRIVEHEIGYRAEFAYPSELYCEDPKLAAAVARMYGVPCAVEALPGLDITIYGTPYAFGGQGLWLSLSFQHNWGILSSSPRPQQTTPRALAVAPPDWGT